MNAKYFRSVSSPRGTRSTPSAGSAPTATPRRHARARAHTHTPARARSALIAMPNRPAPLRLNRPHTPLYHSPTHHPPIRPCRQVCMRVKERARVSTRERACIRAKEGASQRACLRSEGACARAFDHACVRAREGACLRGRDVRVRMRLSEHARSVRSFVRARKRRCVRACVR